MNAKKAGAVAFAALAPLALVATASAKPGPPPDDHSSKVSVEVTATEDGDQLFKGTTSGDASIKVKDNQDVTVVKVKDGKAELVYKVPVPKKAFDVTTDVDASGHFKTWDSADDSDSTGKFVEVHVVVDGGGKHFTKAPWDSKEKVTVFEVSASYTVDVGSKK